jgi:hypothetical protein
MSTLSYEASAPAKQTALDAIRAERVSQLPEGLQSETKPLFRDARIERLAEPVDLVGRSVLELGPPEGGDSYLCSAVVVRGHLQGCRHDPGVE